MIPGIVDSQNAPAEFEDEIELPEWLPEGAFIHLDWAENHFYWDGMEQTDPLTGLGGDYNPDDVVPSYGLFMHLGEENNGIPYVFMHGIKLIGSLHSQFVQLMLGGMSLVVEADALSAGYLDYPSGMFLWAFDNDDVDWYDYSVNFSPGSIPRDLDISYPGPGFIDGVFSSTSLMNPFGIQVLAGTLNAPYPGDLTRWGGSINGQAANFVDETDTIQEYQTNWPNIRLFAVNEWDYGLEECYVRRLTVFPPAITAASLEALSAVIYPPNPPNGTFEDVVLLLGFEGDDESSTTLDDSNSAHTVTFNPSGAKIDTSHVIFGTSSLQMRNTFNSFLTIPGSSDFDFGDGPFCIEGWFYIPGPPVTEGFDFKMVCSGGVAGTYSWDLQIQRASGATSSTHAVLQFGYVLADDPDTYKSIPQVGWNTSQFPVGGDIHWCVERDSNDYIRIYINGEIKDVPRRIQGALNYSSPGLKIDNQSPSPLLHSLDEIRITKGSFWYGGAFDPPTEAFPRTNYAPVITSGSTFNFPELLSGVIMTVSATDQNPYDVLTFSMTGGADVAFFDFNTSTRELRFSSPRNFEIPADANSDNVYEAQLTASDGVNNTPVTIFVTVTDLDEAAGLLDLETGDTLLFENGDNFKREA